ncbi:MAG: 2-C-methyl-D-erythritol 4-phosphate cytidylyltransferase [Muribaculaceae bacterium]|nr:2-C-methyl-D-erythritol 4-phosphate cytidylyltransferase [Muribaculaceae bacterium]
MVSGTLAIIVAAGSGRRFGSPLPKQFCMLGTMPVLGHTIGRLRSLLPGDARIALVLHPDYFEVWKELAQEYGTAREDILVAGGATRAESVSNALNACHPGLDELVLVHDGVRPFVTAEILEGLYSAIADGADCAIPAVGLTDSIRRLDADGTSESVDRSMFRAVQTPQAFPGGTLVEAYRKARTDFGLEGFTDDASVVARCIPGARTMLTAGSPYNIKITNPFDLKIAEALL